MTGLFHRDAPITVRIGALGVLLLAMADATHHLYWLRAVPVGEATFRAGLLRTAVGLALGVLKRNRRVRHAIP